MLELQVCSGCFNRTSTIEYLTALLEYIDLLSMTYQKSLELSCLRASYDWQGTRHARQSVGPAVDTLYCP